jgi:hypothetical protein
MLNKGTRNPSSLFQGANEQPQPRYFSILCLKETEDTMTGNIEPLSLNLHSFGITETIEASLYHLVSVLRLIGKNGHKQHKGTSLLS